MDPLLQTELATPAPTIAYLVKVQLIGGDTIRLVLGGGTVVVGEGEDAETYVGRHETLGAIGSIEGGGDGIETQATRCTITVTPPSGTAIATITDPLVQDSPVEVWKTAVDRATGRAIGEPDLIFQGELDYGDLTVGESWALALECGTEEGRLVEPNDERRLTHAFHQTAWEGELGLEYVGLAYTIYWRVQGPSGAIVTGAGGTTTNLGRLSGAAGGFRGLVGRLS